MEKYADAQQQIYNIIKKNNGAIYGVSSISNYMKLCGMEEEESVHPEELLPDSQSIIIIGMKMIDSIWDKLKGYNDIHSKSARNYLMNYNYKQLDFIAVEVIKYIENIGFDAYPIEAKNEDKTLGYLSGYFSFKSAALAAGLGRKGKSSLIVTEEFGPRIRWVCVITDMILPFGSPQLEETGKVCGSCKICIAHCPVRAIRFNEEMNSTTIDKLKCQQQMDYCQCALCQGICPIGKKAAQTRRKKRVEG